MTVDDTSWLVERGDMLVVLSWRQLMLESDSGLNPVQVRRRTDLRQLDHHTMRACGGAVHAASGLSTDVTLAEKHAKLSVHSSMKNYEHHLLV